MIPNIRPGKNMVGLMSYLQGEGRANEHTNPHLVAGSPAIMAWWSTDELTHEDALDIGTELDQPRRITGANVSDGKHVWHTSLSLHADDGIKTDEEWAVMVREFMADMGLIDVEGKADVPWAAVRHGLSGKTGNDHVHLAVSLIREDGTKASRWHDRPKSQQACRNLERRHGLFTVIEGRGALGITPAEEKAAEKRGRTEPERVTLGRKVRAFAVSSETEAEFIRRVRRDGLLIRPRMAPGSNTEIVGYAVALKPPAGMDPVFFAGSKLARDLGIGVLRQDWNETQESSAEAVEEWQASKFGKPVTRVGREAETLSDREMEAAAGDLEAMRERLRSVPFGDHEEYRRTAAFVSGAFASWSNAVEPTPGPLAHAADEIARSAQVARFQFEPRPVRSGPMGLRVATSLALASTGSGTAAHLAMFRQMSYLARAVHDYNSSRGDLARMNGIVASAQRDLKAIAERLEKAAAEPVVASAGVERYATRSAGRGSVIGDPLSPSVRRETVKDSGADLSR